MGDREIGQFGVLLQLLGVVPDVVAGEEGEQDEVGLDVPDPIAEREQLLGGAVIAHAEVEDLDVPPPEARTPRQLTLEHRAKAVLQADLDASVKESPSKAIRYDPGGFVEGCSRSRNPSRLMTIYWRPSRRNHPRAPARCATPRTGSAL